jgi:hypothetical protein
MRPNEDNTLNGDSSESHSIFEEERTIGINVSMPLNMLKNIDKRKKREGISRSELIRNAIITYLKN